MGLSSNNTIQSSKLEVVISDSKDHFLITDVQEFKYSNLISDIEGEIAINNILSKSIPYLDSLVSKNSNYYILLSDGKMPTKEDKPHVNLSVLIYEDKQVALEIKFEDVLFYSNNCTFTIYDLITEKTFTTNKEYTWKASSVETINRKVKEMSY